MQKQSTCSNFKYKTTTETTKNKVKTEQFSYELKSIVNHMAVYSSTRTAR